MAATNTMIDQHIDLTRDELFNIALERKEGRLCSNGALATESGARTGRSPKDRFIVKDDITEKTVAWGNANQPISTNAFQAFWERAEAYLSEKDDCFISHLRVGACEENFLPVEVTTETAYHNLFAHHMFIRTEQPYAGDKTPWKILSVPFMLAEPARDGSNSEAAIMVNFTSQQVVIAGTRYAGEMKKSMFTALSFLLAGQGILPMHCSANASKKGDTALFFGLSGTGKTTLSADPARFLIGDDEHGWSEKGIFNLEGGCYAKCIDLSQEREPMIWNAIRHGTIMENVVLKPNGDPDYTDTSLTQNSRAAYPRDFIPNSVPSNQGQHPNAVVFLTCDLYGVLPPVSILTKEQAAYHFLSGYTALVGSTEVGSTAGVKPTFSMCFGAPFFIRDAHVYADLLMKRLNETDATVYLVNTGWTQGPYGEGGKRFDIPTTRAVIDAVLSGELLNTPTQTLTGFQLTVPTKITGVDDALLNPKTTWAHPEKYQEFEQLLMQQFSDNIKQFDVPEAVRRAGPHSD